MLTKTNKVNGMLVGVCKLTEPGECWPEYRWDCVKLGDHFVSPNFPQYRIVLHVSEAREKV